MAAYAPSTVVSLPPALNRENNPDDLYLEIHSRARYTVQSKAELK